MRQADGAFLALKQACGNEVHLPPAAPLFPAVSSPPPPRFDKQAFELQGKVLGIIGGAGRIGCEVHLHAPGTAASLPLNNV